MPTKKPVAVVLEERALLVPTLQLVNPERNRKSETTKRHKMVEKNDGGLESALERAQHES